MNAQDRFDKFTERARKVFSLAQEEAQRFQHNYIGTEHLLLGLVREGEGVAAKVLQNLGVELNKVRSSVEFIIGRGDRVILGQLGLTPRAKKVVELAADEAHHLNHHYIGTEHLLLGLIREGEGIAAGVLESLGVRLEQVRKMTLTVLGQPIEESRQVEVPELQEIIETLAAPEHTGTTSMPLSPLQDEEDGIPAPVSGRDRFDRFTERARKVLTLAQEEAQRLLHNYIGTEHLLLGLVREGEGIAAKVLTNRGIELKTVRADVEYIIGHGDRIVLGEVGLTPRSKKSIELAIDEARRLNHHYIGTEHILLGLLRDGEGIAASVLASFGLTLEDARQETIAVLSSSVGRRAQTPVQTASVEAKEKASVPQQSLQDEEDFTPAPSTGSSDISDIFSIRARRVIDAALEEAQRLQHHYVGPEHLLLGLISEESGSATHILNNLGVEREKVRSAVEFIINRGVKYSALGETRLTPRSHKVIQLAIDEARTLNDTLVGTEHLLLGILREGEGIAAGVLASVNVSVENARGELKRIRENQERA